MYNLVVLGIIAAATLAQATAQVSLSTTGGVQCYGELVTLLCRHPVLPQEPEYLNGEVFWKRDGRGIIASGLGRTNPNPMTTKLEFTITDSTVGNYTCFLRNAVRGGVDESNTVTVRPSMPPPPSVTATPGITNISFHLEHAPMACSYDLSFLVSWYTAVTGGQEDGKISTPNTSILVSPLQPGTRYTVWVQSVAKAEGMTLFSEKNEHVWTTLHNTENSSNVSTSVVPSPTPSDTDQADSYRPTSGGLSGGAVAIIGISIVVFGGVVATLIAVGFILWKKKKRSYDVQGGATAVSGTERQLLLSAHITGHYEALSCENDCPNEPPPLECTVTYREQLDMGEKIVNNDVLCADDDSGYPCSLDLHNSKDLLQSVACKADEVVETALPLPVQETTPEDGCCSLITSLSSPEEESLTDQHVPSQPELPLVGHLPPSMTANEKDKDFTPPKPESTTSMDKPPAKLLLEPVVFTSAPPVEELVIPEQESTTSMDEPTAKFLSESVVLTSAPLTKQEPFRCLGTDGTVTGLNLQCGDIPVNIPIHPFNPYEEDEEELPHLESTAPSDHNMLKSHDLSNSISEDKMNQDHDPPPSVYTNPQQSPPLPPPHSPSDLGYQNNVSVDLNNSISEDKTSQDHDPPPSVYTNPQQSPPLPPPHSPSDLGYQNNVSVISKYSGGGGFWKTTRLFQQDGSMRVRRKSMFSQFDSRKKQGLLTVAPQHVVHCLPVVCTGGGAFCVTA